MCFRVFFLSLHGSPETATSAMFPIAWINPSRALLVRVVSAHDPKRSSRFMLQKSGDKVYFSRPMMTRCHNAHRIRFFREVRVEITSLYAQTYSS